MGLKRSSAANANWTATGFPTFRMQEGVTNTSLAYLMFAGYMMGDRSKIYGRPVHAQHQTPSPGFPYPSSNHCRN